MGKGLSVCIGFLLVVSYLMRFFHVPDPELLFALPLAVCLAVCLWKRPIRITLIDIALLLLWVYGLCSPSVNRAGTLMSATGMANSLFAYFLMRCLFSQCREGSRNIAMALSACIAVLSLFALCQFFIYTKCVYNVGFDSLYDFRFLYRPLGVPSNEWNALQWLWGGMLAVAYLQTNDKRLKGLCLVAAMAVWCIILLSFSRGGYIAALICIILCGLVCYRRLSTFRTWVIGGCFALLSLFLCWQFKTEMAQVVRMNETVSQKRSTATRLEAMDFAKETVGKHAWGVGKGNYSLAHDFYIRGEQRSDSFTSYAGNMAAKILVEGGYAGIVIFLLMLFSVIAHIIYAKKREYWFLSIFLIGFFIKEITFPTFYDSGITQMSAFFILAYIQKENAGKDYSRIQKFTALIPLFVWTGLFIGRKAHESKGCTAALIREYIGNHSKASLEKAIKQSPMDIQLHYYKAVEERDTIKLKELSHDYPNKILYRWTLYEWYRESGDINNATEELAFCILNHPRLLATDYWQKLWQDDFRIAQSVENKLRSAIQAKPEDAIQLAKYGSVALSLGDRQLAEQYLTTANRQLPNLSRVWGNLAIIEADKGNTDMAELYNRRMNLLEQGIFAQKVHSENNKQDIKKILNQDYRFLFFVWYNTSLEK